MEKNRKIVHSFCSVCFFVVFCPAASDLLVSTSEPHLAHGEHPDEVLVLTHASLVPC